MNHHQRRLEITIVGRIPERLHMPVYALHERLKEAHQIANDEGLVRLVQSLLGRRLRRNVLDLSSSPRTRRRGLRSHLKQSTKTN